MFCPKCGQQQASDQMRFCSRCGFTLGTVTDLLARDGVPMCGAEGDLSPRQKGVRQGVQLLFASLVIGFMTALLSVFVIGRPELFIPLTAGVLFLSGILRITYAYMFEQSDEAVTTASAPQLQPNPYDYALPSAKNNFVSSLDTRRVNTAEIIRPPSVTEHTTKLLDID